MDADDDLIEPYDSEIPKIERVLAELSRKVGTRQDHQAFRREAEERFAEIGFVVSVLLVPGEDAVLYPKISITGRITKTEFDPEKMAWEVQHDVLGIDEPGVVSQTKDGLIVVKDPKKLTSFSGPASN